jgi:hypothetical protein
MPNFPVARLMDTVIGAVDFHTVFIPPAPAPIPWTPHGYLGRLLLWNTPQFPVFSSGLVLVNGIPACTVGAMGYGVHIPIFVPAPPTFTNFMTYWCHHLINIPKALGFIMKTIFANLAISGVAASIAAISSKNGGGAAAASFMYDVAGVDPDHRKSAWEVIKANLSMFTQWQTYVHLLIPPAPYPVGQASTAIGCPKVMVNGGHIAFVGPLLAHSCSELPLVPNAHVLGFCNVYVGMTLADLARAIAVQAAKGAVAFGIQQAGKPGQTGTSCK